MNVASAREAAPCRAPELTPLSDWTSCIVELWSSTVSSIIDCMGAAEQMNTHKALGLSLFLFMLLKNVFAHHKLCQALIMRSKKIIFFNIEITATDRTRRHIFLHQVPCLYSSGIS